MCNSCITTNATLKTDPTRTTSLRKAFVADLYKRFRKLKGMINEEIVKNDGFGLKVNQRFDFPRSDEKIAAFMSWLSEAQRQNVLNIMQGQSIASAASQSWMRVYIDTAYQRGIAQASANLRKGGARVSDEWVRSAFNRPVHADRLGLIYTRVFSELKGITDVMDQQISRVLAQGIAEGKNPRQIAREINNRVDKIGITRARTLARTEVISAHAEASLNTYEEAGIEGVEVEAEFSTAGDNRVCPECEKLEGRIYTIQESRGVIPVHPNCLTGDSLVSARSGITAASKRWFDGDIFTIITSSGNKLTCTPNHPILTDRGWVAAKDINNRHKIVSDGLVDWASIGGGDNDDMITTIHDVFESLSGSSDMATVPVPMSTPDFHGDGTNGEIAQIVVNRNLLTKIYPHFFKEDSQFGFIFRNILRSSRKGFHSLFNFIFGNRPPLGCSMCGRNLMTSLLLRHLRPFKFFCFRLRSKFNSAINEPFIDSVPTDAQIASDIINGLTGKVFLDNVVSVKCENFSGHVYNLQTCNGTFIAQGMVTHNCRCAWLPKVVNGTGIELR